MKNSMTIIIGKNRIRVFETTTREGKPYIHASPEKYIQTGGARLSGIIKIAVKAYAERHNLKYERPKHSIYGIFSADII